MNFTAYHRFLFFSFLLSLSSLLLFNLEFLIGKVILPWYGGVPMLWSICLLFFMVILMVGYFYAHLITRFHQLSTGAIIHVMILTISLAFTTPIPDPIWRPTSETVPLFHILTMLFHNIGFPFFVLSSTLPLVTHWFSALESIDNPLSFYSISNLASFVALLTYPILIEPNFGIAMQGKIWLIGYIIFVLLSLIVSIIVIILSRNAFIDKPYFEDKSLNPLTINQQLWWFFCSITGGILLLAVSTKITQDLSVTPILWTLPLSGYLLSFVLVFRPESSGTRNPLYFYLSAAMLPVIVLNLSLQYVIIAPFQVFIYCISLFFFSLVCHGELAATAPDWQYATRFYLIVSLGGVVGAIFVNFIAPWAFSEYFELHLGVLLLTVILMVNFIKGINKYIKKRRIVRSLLFFFVPFFLVLAFGFYLISDLTFNRLLYKSRNFFGIQRVVEEESKNGVKRLFFSNNTIHGFHPLGEGQGKIPNAYYGDGSGVGAAFTYLLARQPSIAVGDVGLGVGTIAAWGRSGDSFRFYEINPAVPKVADTWFNFLSATSAEVQIIIGDGRLSLEKENTHRFDLLVLDAFNGDGIPAHLLTKEAFVIWLRHLDNDGIIAANISNQHLYLRPIFVQLAKHFELHLQTYEQAANLPAGLFHNQWVLLSRKGEIFADPHLQKGISKIPTKIEIPLWTDDYSNIFEIMKWRYGVE